MYDQQKCLEITLLNSLEKLSRNKYHTPASEKRPLIQEFLKLINCGLTSPCFCLNVNSHCISQEVDCTTYHTKKMREGINSCVINIELISTKIIFIFNSNITKSCSVHGYNRVWKYLHFMSNLIEWGIMTFYFMSVSCMWDLT